MTLAVVVMAHRDPAAVRRFIDALDPAQVFLHCDVKMAASDFAATTSELPERVSLLRRRSCTLASWSLVDVELDGVRAALATPSTTHIVIASGSDYPLQSTAALLDGLNENQSLMQSMPMPYEPWSTPRHRDGGMFRLDRRYLVFRDQLLTVRGIPAHIPIKRSIPADVVPRAGLQWKIYCRRDAEALMNVVAARPDIVAFFRSTFIPEESFVPSVLSSPALVGADTVDIAAAAPWFMDWNSPTPGHPRWLTEDDLPAISAARSAHANPALFLRKVSSDVSGALLNQLDVFRD